MGDKFYIENDAGKVLLVPRKQHEQNISNRAGQMIVTVRLHLAHKYSVDEAHVIRDQEVAREGGRTCFLTDAEVGLLDGLDRDVRLLREELFGR